MKLHQFSYNAFIEVDSPLKADPECGKMTRFPGGSSRNKKSCTGMRWRQFQTCFIKFYISLDKAKTYVGGWCGSFYAWLKMFTGNILIFIILALEPYYKRFGRWFENRMLWIKDLFYSAMDDFMCFDVNEEQVELPMITSSGHVSPIRVNRWVAIERYAPYYTSLIGVYLSAEHYLLANLEKFMIRVQKYLIKNKLQNEIYIPEFEIINPEVTQERLNPTAQIMHVNDTGRLVKMNVFSSTGKKFKVLAMLILYRKHPMRKAVDCTSMLIFNVKRIFSMMKSKIIGNRKSYGAIGTIRIKTLQLKFPSKNFQADPSGFP